MADRSRYLASAILIGFLALVGCSAGQSENSSHDESTVFTGTPAEYVTLLRGCLEERGIETGDLPNSTDRTGYLTSTAGHTPEQLTEAGDQCRAELGEPKSSGLSNSELRSRYDARSEQWTCFQAEGLVTGDPPTFTTFIDRYQRSGQSELWEPQLDVSPLLENEIPVNATDVCPRNDSW